MIEKMAGRYIARREHFGYVIFDKEKLKHRFLKETEVLPGNAVIWDTKLYSRTDILSAPIRIYWELTNACTLRCRHCFNQSGQPLPNELSTEEAMKVLQGIRKDGVFDVRISGGELTQRADWVDVLTEARRLGLATSINSNGVYREKHNATVEKLASLNLEQIAFSVDGSRDYHDYLRGTGSFDAVVRSLADLYSTGFRHLRINTVITRGSAKGLGELLSIAGKYCDEMNFFYMRIAGRANGIIDEAMTMEELKALDAEIEKMKKDYPNVNVLHGSEVLHINSIGDKDLFTGLKQGLPDGHTRFNLFADGSIHPGGYTPRLTNIYYLGNIRHEEFTFSRVWHQSVTLDEFRKRSEEVLRKCGVCGYLLDKKCQGASMEMDIYRETHGKNPYCPCDMNVTKRMVRGLHEW